MQQLEYGDLRESAWVLHRYFVRADHALNNLLRSRHPAHTRAWRDDLRKGVHSQDAAIGVQAKIAGDQGLHVFLHRGNGSGGGYSGPAGLVDRQLDEVIGVVFDDEEVVFLGDAVDGLPTGKWLRDARGVLASWDCVQQTGFLTTASGLVPG